MNPLYIQIKKRITESLVCGLWHPGQSIPSEIELAQSYNVSQGTVRKAIDELAAEKILIRRQGKGTFVASHNEEHNQLRFLRLTSSLGDKEKLDNKLISFEKEKASNGLAKTLGINSASTVVSIKRVLTFNEKPLILDLIKVPAASFRGLTPGKIIEKKGSMYRMYEADFGIQMLHAKEKIRAVTASPEAAELLGVSIGSPILSVERTSFTYDNKAIEWRLGLCLTENHHYATELE
ncbi:GntR family transcriptional regulator [Methylophilaceae bacterium]|jgi:GntR family transcriptional regulator|nr:GntR family transcriptional regulator [Methylophilaceae bacterium]MDC0128322.1 GntR family transcriptional regulator [Methylophilaceae bacterium]MDC0877777.1 GntR family transcriptional regulator [Methylophilaceae bacterium]